MEFSVCHFSQVTTQEAAQEVSKLAQVIWREHYTSIIGGDQVEYMLKHFQSVEAIMASLDEGMLYYLIVYNQQPVGYYAIKHHEPFGKLFLSKLYLLTSFRGKGIASSSMKEIIKSAKEHHLSSIWLTVNKNNQNSILVYQKMGFCKVKSVVNSIGQGYVMDDDVMAFSFAQDCHRKVRHQK